MAAAVSGLPSNPDGPGIGMGQGIEEAQQRRLAAAVRAEDGHPVGGRNPQCEPVDRGHAIVSERHAIELEQTHRPIIADAAAARMKPAIMSQSTGRMRGSRRT